MLFSSASDFVIYIVTHFPFVYVCPPFGVLSSLSTCLFTSLPQSCLSGVSLFSLHEYICSPICSPVPVFSPFMFLCSSPISFVFLVCHVSMSVSPQYKCQAFYFDRLLCYVYYVWFCFHCLLSQTVFSCVTEVFLSNPNLLCISYLCLPVFSLMSSLFPL